MVTAQAGMIVTAMRVVIMAVGVLVGGMRMVVRGTHNQSSGSARAIMSRSTRWTCTSAAT